MLRILSSFIMLLTTEGLAQTPDVSSSRDLPALNYELRFVPSNDRTDVHVDLRFQGDVARAIKVGLPEDSEFGTPNLSAHIKSWEALGGSQSAQGPRPSSYLVRPNETGEIHLRYVLSVGEGQFGSRTYAPAVGPDYVHLFGSQWMLRIGDLNASRSVRIRLLDLPPGWQSYSSLAADPALIEVEGSYSGLERSAIGAMRGSHSEFELAGNQVAVQVELGIANKSPAIVASIERIVSMQRDIYGHDVDPHFNVVVLPRPGNVAGIALPNVFVCFVMSEITALQLQVLLAHEMLHSWTHVELGPENAEAENFVRNQWLIEGVTDYLARKMLLDAGLITLDQFAHLINRDIINLAENPLRNRSFAEIMGEANAGKFGTSHAKLSYYRGALIALDWGRRLEESGVEQNLAEVMAVFYRKAKSLPRMSLESFYAFFEEYGLDVESDLESYILQGDPIDLSTDALGDEFGLVSRKVPAFVPGFSISASLRAKEVRGVETGGPAHRAGLRDNTPLVSIANSNRFSNAWDPEAPLVVTIEGKDGQEKVAFLPRGDEVLTLRLFERK